MGWREKSFFIKAEEGRERERKKNIIYSLISLMMISRFSHNAEIMDSQMFEVRRLAVREGFHVARIWSGSKARTGFGLHGKSSLYM